MVQDQYDSIMIKMEIFSEETINESKLKVIKNETSGAKSDPRSVDFEPSA